MSRRKYLTANVPIELAQFVDALVSRPNSLGIISRDEFVKISMAMLAASMANNSHELTVLEKFLEQTSRRRSAISNAPAAANQEP